MPSDPHMVTCKPLNIQTHFTIAKFLPLPVFMGSWPVVWQAVTQGSLSLSTLCTALHMSLIFPISLWLAVMLSKWKWSRLAFLFACLYSSPRNRTPASHMWEKHSDSELRPLLFSTLLRDSLPELLMLALKLLCSLSGSVSRLWLSWFSHQGCYNCKRAYQAQPVVYLWDVGRLENHQSSFY